MHGAFFSANPQPSKVGDQAPIIQSYMVIQSHYHNTIDVNALFNGKSWNGLSWNNYMREEMQDTKRRINLIYTSSDEALKSLESPRKIQNGTAYLIRFSLTKTEAEIQIADGNFNKIIVDLVDCRDLLSHANKPAVVANSKFDPVYLGMALRM